MQLVLLNALTWLRLWENKKPLDERREIKSFIFMEKIIYFNFVIFNLLWK